MHRLDVEPFLKSAVKRFKVEIVGARFITYTDVLITSSHWNNIMIIIYVKSNLFK